MLPTTLNAKFDLGQTVITANAKSKLEHLDVIEGIVRHANGDWGDVCETDRQLNDEALQDGSRLLSVYRGTDGTVFWIITEWDRSVTTVLLPEDY